MVITFESSGTLTDTLHAAETRIREADNLIVDVRRNDGGFDSSYKPLLGLLGPATYRSAVPDLLVTEANLSGYEAVLKLIPATHAHERSEIAAIIDRMTAAWKARRRGRSEVWIPQTDHEEVTIVAGGAVKARPERVWLITGPACGSSCEQFVLDVKQNRRITLVGRPTHGSLDASNVRPVSLPSGTIDLWYATTYVRRPPGQEIDDVGIRPSIPLPDPKDDAGFAREIIDVQRMVEADAR
jgi:C-terminal processing protease CtpA/Prc